MTPQEKAKQRAEIMLAYANGAEIEFTDVLNPWKLCTFPVWDWDDCDYRVKKPAPKVVKLEAWLSDCDYRVKKPAPKVVKLEAWLSSCGEFRMFVAGSTNPPHWKRIPSLDLEYTEDES